MNLKKYIDYYVNDENHLYISKVKQFNEDSFVLFAKGLNIINSILGTNPSQKALDLYKKFKPLKTQLSIFEEDKNSQVEFDQCSSLFVGLQILSHGLVDISHLGSVNSQKYNQFNDIKREFNIGKNYNFFVKKYGSAFLTSDLQIYTRNFISWLSKFGFMGKTENRRYIFVTEAGIEFLNSYLDQDKCSAIFLNQIKKYQVWNPTIDLKYSRIKVKPYFLLLEILLVLPNNYFTKDEYVLFITKIASHNEKEIQTKLNLLLEFRNLNEIEKKRYINTIIRKDEKQFKDRERSNYERLLDSSGKEISAYTFGGIVSIDEGSKKIVLKDINRASFEVDNFRKSTKFLDIKKKADWIRHLGNLNGLTIEDIVDVYLNEGFGAEDIKDKLKNIDQNIDEVIKERILEKEIEDYFVKNIKEIDKNLVILEKPIRGRQFPTHIGIIDLLCKNIKTNEYYVIEFKRDQVSDDTIGQILRYMGWVHLNLTKAKEKVNGIIVGKDFSDKIHFSLMGIQSNHIFQLIRLHTHDFDGKNKPVLN